MKITVFALTALLVTASAPALAQDAAAAPHAGHTTGEAAPRKLTIESPIEKLMATPQSAAILLKHIPGINEHPAYDQFKGMNLLELKPWSAGAVTDAIIAAVSADLAGLSA